MRCSRSAVRVKGKKVIALDQDFVPVDTIYSVLDSFNQQLDPVEHFLASVAQRAQVLRRRTAPST
jgi:hypothetical protein